MDRLHVCGLFSVFGVRRPADCDSCPMWPRERTGRSGDIAAKLDGQRQSQSLWVLTRGTARSGSRRKTSESLAAQPSGFGGDQTRAPATDCV